MKKSSKSGIQEMLDELQPKPVVMPKDLENQILSKNPEQRVRQLDQQAQEQELEITGN